MKIHFHSAAAAFVLLCTSLSLAAQTVDETRPAAADARVELVAVTGDFEIVGHDRDTIELTGRLGEDVRELLIEGGPDHWRIELKMQQNRTIGWGRKNSSELRLMVPRAGRIEASSVSGDMSLRDLAGDTVEASTVSGDLELRQVRPDRLSASSVSGDVEADGGGRSSTRMKSVSGDVSLTGGDGRIELQSVSGDLEIDGAEVAELDVETVSGDVAAHIRPAAQARLQLSSHSGDVLLRLPRDAGVRIKAQTFSGKIRTAFGGEVQRGRGPGARLEHESGDGAVRVQAKAFSGDVILETFD